MCAISSRKNVEQMLRYGHQCRNGNPNIQGLQKQNTHYPLENLEFAIENGPLSSLIYHYFPIDKLGS